MILEMILAGDPTHEDSLFFQRASPFRPDFLVGKYVELHTGYSRTSQSSSLKIYMYITNTMMRSLGYFEWLKLCL